MKIIRKAQLNLNYCTETKKCLLSSVIFEYNHLVNEYIKLYWTLNETNKNKLLLKEWIYKIDSCLSYRLRKHSAKKAIEIITSIKNKQNKNKSKSEKNLTCKIPELKSYVLDLDSTSFSKITSNHNLFCLSNLKFPLFFMA